MVGVVVNACVKETSEVVVVVVGSVDPVGGLTNVDTVRVGSVGDVEGGRERAWCVVVWSGD